MEVFAVEVALVVVVVVETLSARPFAVAEAQVLVVRPKDCHVNCKN